jgi:hypothetical protein
MHSYLHKNFILAKSGCYTSTPQTCSTLTVACYSMERFNNSGQAAQSDG